MTEEEARAEAKRRWPWSSGVINKPCVLPAYQFQVWGVIPGHYGEDFYCGESWEECFAQADRKAEAA